jgi:hypothetical protein
VEPDYFTRFPSLGLLKLGRYHKDRGDVVDYVRGKTIAAFKPDLIYVTSLFTYAWKPVHEAVRHYKSLYPDAEVWLGGLYASLLPEHAKESGADILYRGLFEEAEDLMPAYELLEEKGWKWDGSIIFSSRGCIRNCIFCAVPKLEGKPSHVRYSIKHLIYPKHTRVILWDNNILGCSNWRSVFDELHEIGLKVDFNQGLDARLFTDEVAEKLAKLRMEVIRIAYDDLRTREAVEKAIQCMSDAGIKKRKIIVYTLYNYTDDPADFLERVKDLLNWGVVCYPMRYEPVFSLVKNQWVSEKWDEQRLNMVARARRVIGFGGVFPPYQGLIDKFNKAQDFDQAFSLYPIEKDRIPKEQTTLDIALLPKPLLKTKNKTAKYAGGPDWRKIKRHT